ncbi:hypothetical protein FGADI_9243 [Fusarium gaditjirri]|uniref:Uncharacterized protein n=1 Tax=Fusarium gaditjirri TaxID=282569 RepID=A0A8H4T0H8_9HYPO|nr:hypothetical protein FGADI_9243 [Fusarium gaditjirri]
MEMSFQFHRPLRSWPTTKFQAEIYQSQDKQRRCDPDYTPVQEVSLQDSHSRSVSVSSAYSVPETFPRRNLKIETASQLRSFSADSGRILRPPLELHQRPFLAPKQIQQAKPAVTQTHHSNTDSIWSLEPPLVPPKDHLRTSPPQGHSPDISREGDADRLKHNTFGYLEPPPAYTSYWSETSGSESGTDTEDEDELTDIEEAVLESSEVDKNLVRFSIIEAHRVSFHTWILNPKTAGVPPDAPLKLNLRGQIENGYIAWPACSKKAKRWGVIFQ